MKAFNTLGSTRPVGNTAVLEPVWSPLTHPMENRMEHPTKEPVAHQRDGGLPSPNPAEPLRVAVLGDQQKNRHAVTLLKRIPGIEIVGVSETLFEDPTSTPGHELPCPIWECPKTLLNQTAPQVVLNLTNDPEIATLVGHYRASNPEPLGGHTAILLERLINSNTESEAQMAQIEKLANIGTLTSGILHDINNPLYVILGFSENLTEEPDPVTIREQASEVLQAAKRIITMCRELNLYSRQTTPQECVPVTLTEQLEEAMKVAKFASGLENMQIVRDYAAEPIILARPEAIIQICVNLIINALQAMNGQGTLTLGARNTDHLASISIGDTGPGIPPEKMDKIFEPFYTTKPPGQGTGLGLHSVRSLVQEYGGQVHIQSTVGQGTTFHLEFPLCTPSTMNQDA